MAEGLLNPRTVFVKFLVKAFSATPDDGEYENARTHAELEIGREKALYKSLYANLQFWSDACQSTSFSGMFQWRWRRDAACCSRLSEERLHSPDELGCRCIRRFRETTADAPPKGVYRRPDIRTGVLMFGNQGLAALLKTPLARVKLTTLPPSHPAVMGFSTMVFSKLLLDDGSRLVVTVEAVVDRSSNTVFLSTNDVASTYRQFRFPSALPIRLPPPSCNGAAFPPALPCPAPTTTATRPPAVRERRRVGNAPIGEMCPRWRRTGSKPCVRSKGALNSQLAPRTKAKQAPNVVRLSPLSSPGGTYDGVTVLRDISLAMWPRTKGGKPVIEREVTDMIDKSRRPDPHSPGCPVHVGVLMDKMLDKLKSQSVNTPLCRPHSQFVLG
ncbi:unnamed protein product [Vitrella brassicaformis CCMP3155]|uniref:Uncharacterized protein n=1 Tax=Vitrella brassicaformis (strain CCMP3155) TaxID=1169540 RepID=A0A0G4G361_VITBC|nr:unnamed protein product [Vitrella brassicaformis CCMP3155]|eukprot:CEM22541.1 unnamed protein product [Vitrella brassicaformis CCMP3155]